MNYFAHGWGINEDPYVLAGTAVPDWLSVANRRTRIREPQTTKMLANGDPRVRSLGRGIRLHHHDDKRFHESRAFHETTFKVQSRICQALPRDDGFRPHFLAHLLVELLLDATLIAESPRDLDAYYDRLQEVDPSAVQNAVNQVAAQPTLRLADVVRGFNRMRFLADYQGDKSLLRRVNQVMHRVGLRELPSAILKVFAEIRETVNERRVELLPAAWLQDRGKQMDSIPSNA